MNYTILLGYIGSFLTSITFIPQVYKSWKTRSVEDLSIWMILSINTSSVCWLVYGVGISSGPVIIANCLTLAMSLLLLFFKFSFRS